MANKQDVVDAFYEGVCVVLSADHLRNFASGQLELDMDEFRDFLDRNSPDYDEYRIYLPDGD